MKIAVISGSSRPKSQSLKIANWVVEKLRDLDTEPILIDLHEHVLPTEINLLDLKNEPTGLKAWSPVQEILQDSLGFVVVSPEWNGMAPPALMNMFEYASVSSKPLAHKPGQIITVSNTDGGSYPAAQLRVHGGKNNHSFYNPEIVIIRNCEKVFNSESPEVGNSADEYLQARVEHSLRIFLEYVKAMQSLRENSKVDLLKYPNGM
ncbi:MAG TPA: NAD(P)H-dependent oxidoreductase [Candidatus Saccharimonadales bacterium]|nr:NAD(P)H-dependent oxidoreductase [Candidatus Saccharimonadales bacterium]